VLDAVLEGLNGLTSCFLLTYPLEVGPIRDSNVLEYDIVPSHPFLG